MKTPSEYVQGYNTQAAVTGEQIIVAAEAIEYTFRKHGKDTAGNVPPYGGRFTYIRAVPTATFVMM